jgi:hypothetical protein
MYIHTPDGYTPNVLHFHGSNRAQLDGTFNTILNNHIVNGDFDTKRLKIISTWTDVENCCLLKQCKKSNIPITNCVPEDFDKTQEWYMPNKIKFFIQELEKTEQEIVLFLDGYDVLLTHLDDIVERFEKQPYRILFNPSCNNYPDVTIDKIYGRQNRGIYCYFNAGCVIGYTKDLLKFYKECEQYLSIKNPMNSEQYVIRFGFAKYSCDKKQTFIGIDYMCNIFQSMGYLNSHFNGDEVVFYTKEQEIKNNTKVLILSNLIDNKTLPVLQIMYNAEVLKVNSELSQSFIDYILNRVLPKQIVLYTNIEDIQNIDKDVLKRIFTTFQLNEFNLNIVAHENIEQVEQYVKSNFETNFTEFYNIDITKETI